MESIFLLEDDQTLGRGIGMALEGPGRAVTLARAHCRRAGPSWPKTGLTC